MELLKIDYRGRPLRLEGSMAGWQEVFWNNQRVSQINASQSENGEYIHEFTIEVPPPVDDKGQPMNEPEVLQCRIVAQVVWQPLEVTYQLYVNDELQADGKRSYDDIEEQVPFELPKPNKSARLLGLTALVWKFLKSAKVVKAAWLGGSLAIYSWLFTLTFAMALIITLMIHEYGRMQAMRYFGLKTRGIYLIPFYGGFAMKDQPETSRWQSVVIALAGPCFGLSMSLIYMLVYGLSGSLFFGALASFNALVNLFNLLPVLPMAGGHVLKQVSFSMSRRQAMVVYALVAGLGGYLSYLWQMPLLAALLLVGLTELVVAWRDRFKRVQLPMDRYGQLFSLVWYSVIVICFIGVLWFFAGTGDDVLGLPLKILQS